MITFRFCKKCQTETERYASGGCKLCADANTAAWNAANPEKVKVRNAAYRAAHRAETNARSAAWYAKNADRASVGAAARYVANPDLIKARVAAWRAANPEAARIFQHNRRAKERASGGVLSRGLSAKLFKLQKGKCPCCQQPLGDDYHIDHKMPIALGGSNTDDNMQLLRQRCNQQKNAKHPVDFMQSRGFLL